MIKHRKLYPTSDSNSTLPCPDICDSSCPYGCDPYADGYLLPPPAPPPPAQDSHSILSKPNGHLSPLVIVLVTLFSSCFFAVIFYLLAVKFRPRWNFFRRRQRQTPEDTNEEFLDQNHGPTAIDYPIWYINTIGLQPSVIESITIFRYKKGESLIEGTECSVCLNEFQNDETLRLLPKCSHAFHIPCIDTWLRSHINCPVCRAGIVSTTATSIPVVSNALNTNNLGANEDSQSENTEFGDIINVNIRAGEDGFCENRTDTGEITEAQLVDPDVQDVQIVKFNLIHKETSDSPVLEDSDNEDYDEKPMRKCVSVDSLLKVSVCLSESEDNSGSEDQIPGEVSSKKVCGNLKTVRNSDGNYLITQHLHKRPVQMKRSFSYSGRSTLLSSRQYSRTKSSVSSSNPRD